MATIKNTNDWWRTVDENWDNLKDIVFHHLDPILPTYDEPGAAETPRTGRTIEGELEWLKAHRDVKLHRYLNTSWCMASDSYAYSVPGWGDFCDLCSESWVFEEHNGQT